MFHIPDPSAPSIAPLPDDLVEPVLEHLPSEVRPFARYWIPVAVWASEWSMLGRMYGIVVSLTDRPLLEGDVLDGTLEDFERDRCGTAEPLTPKVSWSQAFRFGEDYRWHACDPVEGGPVLHVFVPPSLPETGFWGCVVTTSGGREEDRHLTFGPFTGDEEPRDETAWSESGGYDHLLIRTAYMSRCEGGTAGSARVA